MHQYMHMMWFCLDDQGILLQPSDEVCSLNLEYLKNEYRLFFIKKSTDAC